jgi:hypothetical protein
MHRRDFFYATGFATSLCVELACVILLSYAVMQVMQVKRLSSIPLLARRSETGQQGTRPSNEPAFLSGGFWPRMNADSCRLVVINACLDPRASVSSAAPRCPVSAPAARSAVSAVDTLFLRRVRSSTWQSKLFARKDLRSNLHPAALY